MRHLLVILALAFGLVAASAALRAAAAVGETAPDFTLTGLDGQAHRLSDYKGKLVVLEWNNPDCPFVHKHYDSGNIPKLQHTAQAQGVVWLMINSGAHGQQGGDYTPEQFKAWLDQHHAAPDAYLRDPEGKVGHLYGAKTTPHLFVIRPDGVLAYQGGIDSIRSADQADIPHAENYVAEAIAAVQHGQPVKHANTAAYGCAVKY